MTQYKLDNLPFSEELQKIIIQGSNISCQHIHEGTCLQSGIIRFLSNLKLHSKFIIPLYLIPLIIFQRKKLREQPKQTLTDQGKSILQSLLFLSGYITSCKYLVCKTISLNHKLHPLNFTLAGVLSSVFLLFEKHSRQKDITLFIMPRFLEMFWRLLAKRNWVYKIDYWEFIIFSLAMGLINYYYINEPDRIKSSYLRFFKLIWN